MQAVRRDARRARRNQTLDLLAAPALGALAAFFAQHLLAEPDLGGRDLDELVRLDVFEGDLEREQPGGLSKTFLSEPEARMFVSFFSLQGLTTMSSPRAFSPMIMPW